MPRKVIVLLLLLLLLLPAAVLPTPARWALALHGGAGADPAELSPEETELYLGSLRSALEGGCRILREGGSSLEAVEAVVVVLEDDPLFNAGRGAVLNADGEHELDASIMDGRSLSCGAVAGVRTVKNPVRLAALVMRKTPHVLLAGPGADRFAREMGLEPVEQRYFWTPRAQRRWEEAQASDRGTVGCVALDGRGDLAAATSTGGLTGKRFGRVGDSPIIGAGTYAANRTCAVSCTGTGEEFIRHAVAYQVSARLAYGGMSLPQAVDTVLKTVLAPGDGGVIAVDSQGVLVADFTTQGMYRGLADSQGRFEVGIGR